MANVPWGNETERADYWKSAWNTECKENERYRALGTVEELAALKKALDLMAEDFYDSSDDDVHAGYEGLVSDYIRMAQASKEADHADS